MFYFFCFYNTVHSSVIQCRIKKIKTIFNHFKVSTKKKKWLVVKAKTIDFFKTISIPGVSKIVTTESYLLKLLWIVVILCVFGFGFENISLAITDYYKYDKITNIERVNPENVTFPAITVCTREGYWRDHYKNDVVIEEERVFSNLLKQFVNFKETGFKFFKNNSLLNISNHLDTFKINDHVDNLFYDCLRFNALTNKSLELFKASSLEDGPRIVFNNSYREDVSKNEYYRYTFISGDFFVYVDDNSLNSFEGLQYLQIQPNSFNNIEVEKVSVETKLPEPYNPCKKSSFYDPYHQMNCIEACTYKEIKNKYNCTFQSTLFSIQGLRQCVLFSWALHSPT